LRFRFQLYGFHIASLLELEHRFLALALPPNMFLVRAFLLGWALPVGAL
jgi:hypothetical protein